MIKVLGIDSAFDTSQDMEKKNIGMRFLRKRIFSIDAENLKKSF